MKKYYIFYKKGDKEDKIRKGEKKVEKKGEKVEKKMRKEPLIKKKKKN